MQSEQIAVAKLEQKKRMSVLEERKGDFLPVMKATSNYTWNPTAPSMISSPEGFSLQQMYESSGGYNTEVSKFAGLLDGVVTGVNSSDNAQHTLALGLEVTQTIWAQGRVRKAYEIARLEGRAAICDWQEAQMSVKAEATRLFYQALLAISFVEIAEKRLARSQERHTKSTELFAMNMNSRLDTLNSFVAVSNAEISLLNSKNSLTSVKKRMVSMAHMDLPLDSLSFAGELKPMKYDVPYDLMEEQTLTENKILTKLSSIKEISELSVEIAKGAYYPIIYSGVSIGGVSRFGKSAEFDLQGDRKLFLGAEVELYSFNRRIARIRQAEYDMRIARKRFDEQEREILLLLDNAYTRYKELKEGLETYELSLKSAEVAMEISQQRFAQGQMSALEMESQEDLLLQSEYNLASAIFAHNSALIDLRLIIADYIYEKE